MVCSASTGSNAFIRRDKYRREWNTNHTPNSESVLKAITSYIKVQSVYACRHEPNIRKTLTRAEQDYATICMGQSQTEFQGIGVMTKWNLNNHIGLFNTSPLHSDRYESSSDRKW
jgi:hypothetical protein